MSKILSFLILLVTTISYCQTTSPVFTSWKFNYDSSTASYIVLSQPNNINSTINAVSLNEKTDITDLYYTNDLVYVECEGLASYQMGYFLRNPNVPQAQDYVFKIPRNPVEETNTKSEVPIGGAIGLAVNGVPLFGYASANSYNGSTVAMNGNKVWNEDAWIGEGHTLDSNGLGHPTGGGNYHYHATPIALYGDITEGHSPIIGWSFDGFPIYGPYGYIDPTDTSSGLKFMESSYVKREITKRETLPDGTTLSSNDFGPDVSSTYPLGTFVEDYEYKINAGDLDEYNGRFCKTPEYPNGIYAYFITMDSTKHPAFPYILAHEYYGVLERGNRGTARIPSNAVKYAKPVGNISLEKSMIKVFPTVSNSTINFESNEIIESISLISQTGTLYSKTINFNAIDVSLLPNGAYTLLLKTESDVYSTSIIVMH